jgi:hypothetical protein
MTTGFAALDAKLKDIGSRVAGKACRSGMSKAGTVIARSMRLRVPAAKTPGHSTNELKKAIRSRVSTRNGVIELKVGIDVGKRNYKKVGKGSRVYFLLALGTADRWTGTKGVGRSKKTKVSTGNKRAFRGRVQPGDFISAGLAASQAEAQTVLERTVGEVIAKEAVK